MYVGTYDTDPVIGDGAAKYTPSISERRGSTTTFLHSGMKNADAQTSTSGSVSASRVYDAFGAELSSTGSWQGRFGYAGGFGYQEDDGGFKLLGHRYYDPSTGRFLTRDPAKDGRSWYAYCDHEPISRVDIDGARWTWVYELRDKAGNLIKNGQTRHPAERAGQHRRNFEPVYGEGIEMKIVASYEDEIPDGTRYGQQNRQALDHERKLNLTTPGPENHERYIPKAGFFAMVYEAQESQFGEMIAELARFNSIIDAMMMVNEGLTGYADSQLPERDKLWSHFESVAEWDVDH